MRNPTLGNSLTRVDETEDISPPACGVCAGTMTGARLVTRAVSGKRSRPLAISEDTHRRWISVLFDSFGPERGESDDLLVRMVERKKIVRERTLGRLR